MNKIDELIISCESLIIPTISMESTMAALYVASAAIIGLTTASGIALLAKQNSKEINKFKNELKKKVAEKKRIKEMHKNKYKYPETIEPSEPMPKDEYEKMVRDITNDVKKLIKEYNSNPEIKKLIRKSIEDFFDNIGGPDKDDLRYKLVTKEFERETGISLYLELIEGYQLTKIAVGKVVLYSIADVLNAKYPVMVDTGDGDEGCIYIHFD